MTFTEMRKRVTEGIVDVREVVEDFREKSVQARTSYHKSGSGGSGGVKR